MDYCYFDAAPEEEWNRLLLDGMTVGKGEISPEELYSVVNKRIERTLIRTVGIYILFRNLCFPVYHKSVSQWFTSPPFSLSKVVLTSSGYLLSI